VGQSSSTTPAVPVSRTAYTITINGVRGASSRVSTTETIHYPVARSSFERRACRKKRNGRTSEGVSDGPWEGANNPQAASEADGAGESWILEPWFASLCQNGGCIHELSAALSWRKAAEKFRLAISSLCSGD